MKRFKIMPRYVFGSVILVAVLNLLPACNKLDVPPMDVVQDRDLFTTEGGVAAYMAALYEYLPIEDFRYSTNQSDGFNNWNILVPLAINTGEMISIRGTAVVNPARGYWENAYIAIRYTNHFLQTLPDYRDNFTETRFAELMAEAHFIRAYIYFALVKRYGGVPIIKFTQSFPEQSLEELQVSRDKEEDVYDFIAEDLDIAINGLPPVSVRGRVSKYAAAGFKSRAMLFAASSARYATVALDGLVGIPPSRANEFFKASYDAAKIVEGHASLYRVHADKYRNYVQLFFDENSSENLLVRYYQYPNNGHCYDALFIPFSSTGPQGYSSTYNPTLDYVELFDGIPKDENGHIRVKDENDNCIFFDSRADLFKDAEPRLRASVMIPDDEFKGTIIDVRRGTYVAPIGEGIRYTDNLSVNPFIGPANVRTGTRFDNPLVDIGNGQTIHASGWDGHFEGRSLGTITGFYVRKYMDEERPAALVRLPNFSDQHWIDLRYAEVLLNRAEAAYELHSAGYSDGVDYLADAYQCINDIRERGGANQLTSPSDLNDIQIIRIERRKELAFENKIWWDMRRWRTAHIDLNNTIFHILNPFYVVENGKYVFQRRTDERNARHTFNVNWYYEAIPNAEIGRNPNLLPNNPGY